MMIEFREVKWSSNMYSGISWNYFRKQEKTRFSNKCEFCIENYGEFDIGNK
jgi:hypothetical protein